VLGNQRGEGGRTRPPTPDPMDFEDDYSEESGPDSVCDDDWHW
jgi:hypothetical protein